LNDTSEPSSGLRFARHGGCVPRGRYSDMKSTTAVRFLVRTLLALGLAGCDGCRNEEPAAAPSNGGRLDGASSASWSREQEAFEMLTRARAAPVTDRVDLLRRVVALYDDLPLAADAHFELVVFLRLDPRESTARPALEAAKRFAERRPTDLRVSEAFKLATQSLLREPRPDLHADAFAAWDAWLAERTAKRDADAAQIASEAAHALMLRGRFAEAAPRVEAALAAAGDDEVARLSRLVVLGDLRGQRLGDLRGAREAWFSALHGAALGAEIAKRRTIGADAVAAHLVADQLWAFNRARLRVGEDR
jgi:hypothetical protein